MFWLKLFATHLRFRVWYPNDPVIRSGKLEATYMIRYESFRYDSSFPINHRILWDRHVCYKKVSRERERESASLVYRCLNY